MRKNTDWEFCSSTCVQRKHFGQEQEIEIDEDLDIAVTVDEHDPYHGFNAQLTISKETLEELLKAKGFKIVPI